MSHGGVETFHENGQWFNRVEGEKGVLGPYTSRSEAEGAGREEARRRRREHVVLDEGGNVSERHPYGEDPRDARR
jgi:hypothetical protein